MSVVTSHARYHGDRSAAFVLHSYDRFPSKWDSFITRLQFKPAFPSSPTLVPSLTPGHFSMVFLSRVLTRTFFEPVGMEDVVASRYERLSTGVPFIYKTNALCVSVDCERGGRIGSERMYFSFCGWKKPRVGSFAVLFTMVNFAVWKWKSATTIGLACVRSSMN